ncbi:MAG: LemA family protein [Nocardioidaceae bacterium]
MTWPWIVVLLVVLAALGLWLWWTANRLDRMHHRIDVARATLDAQLLHRSGVSLELATSGALDPAQSLLLVDSAHQARAASAEDFESAESDLSEALRAVFADADGVRALRADPAVAPLMDELSGDCRKVELARRFHNNVVASARGLRSRRRVRWLRLAGRAAQLQTVDLDDVPPAALVDG